MCGFLKCLDAFNKLVVSDRSPAKEFVPDSNSVNIKSLIEMSIFFRIF
jgi:hypothetical protein